MSRQDCSRKRSIDISSQATLRVLGDSVAAAQVLRAPGDTLTVGRSFDCQLRLTDRRLSYYHFKLEWDGAVCRLTDLDSRGGTRVNGRPVSTIELRNGDEIVAGASRFRLLVEQGDGDAQEALPAPVPTVTPDIVLPAPARPDPGTFRADDYAIFQSVERASPKPAQVGDTQDRLLAGLQAKRDKPVKDDVTRLYALIDGTQAIDLVFIARMLGYRAFTLFDGDMSQHVAHAGPCLIELDEAEAFLPHWVAAIGQNAGILLETRSDLADLHCHLRDIFIAADEQGQEYFFRFYDPRVFRMFPPTCTPAELNEFFGVVDCWIVEKEAADDYQVWRQEPSA